MKIFSDNVIDEKNYYNINDKLNDVNLMIS